MAIKIACTIEYYNVICIFVTTNNNTLTSGNELYIVPVP